MLRDKEKIVLNVLKTLEETDMMLGILKCLSRHCPYENKEMRALMGVLFGKIYFIRKKQSETAEILDRRTI